MSTKTLRAKNKPKRKIHKPHSTRSLWTGYQAWAQHFAEYNRYLQDDRDERPPILFGSLWAHQERGLQVPWFSDVDLNTLLDPKRPFVGPPRPPRRKGRATVDEEALRPSPPEAPRHLYILDVDDLLEFTAEDVLTAWAFRTQCCGSKEAAAELYALYRVLSGEDDSYAGMEAYLDAPALLDIFTAAESEKQAVQIGGSFSKPPVVHVKIVEPESVTDPGLSLADVRGLTVGPLKAAWDNRPESFTSLEAAAETLAILRSLNSNEPEKPSYTAMMEHDLIQDLLDYLPLELSPETPRPAVELELLRSDQRTVRTQASVVRPRQGNFRSSLFQRYGGACCITDCRVDTLLEAAHIIPYRGDQSDDVSNGLLLRVDLHRLFDAHLVTINPHTFQVEVANSIDDAGYQSYHGKRLFTYSPKPRTLFLETHYATFKRAASASR